MALFRSQNQTQSAPAGVTKQQLDTVIQNVSNDIYALQQTVGSMPETFKVQSTYGFTSFGLGLTGLKAVKGMALFTDVNNNAYKLYSFHGINFNTHTSSGFNLVSTSGDTSSIDVCNPSLLIENDANFGGDRLRVVGHSTNEASNVTVVAYGEKYII